MNRDQYKDPVSHVCLAGTVVASWSVMQEVAGSSPYTVMTNIFVAQFSVKPFRENSIENGFPLPCSLKNVLLSDM